MKPRIKKIGPGCWMCADDRAFGFGASPVVAYIDYSMNFARSVGFL